MQSIIDTNILPNPFAPNVGDVYGRKAVAISDGAPLRVVVLDTGGIETHITVLADGREELVTSLPLYLASIPGIAPIGRVRAADREPMPAVDRSVEPADWNLRDHGEEMAEQRWACSRYDEKVYAFGATKEAAIAAAWREVDRVDLHALAVKLLAEQMGAPRAHGPGLVLLSGDRVREDGEDQRWALQVIMTYGVSPIALTDFAGAYGDSSDFDIGDDLPTDPAVDQCEVLCAVEYDPGDEHCAGSFGVAVVKVDGKPAVESYP